MEVLVIAPHPDDEVLGCGGTIARHSKEGDNVYLCVVTKGYTPEWSEEFLRNRPKEVRASNRVLKVRKTFFLDHPTVKLDTIPQKELNASLARVFAEVRPDVVYVTHNGDVNRDHRLVYEAALVACRPVGHRVKKLLCYETVSETEWGAGLAPFVPNYYVDISGFMDDKIAAMEAYKSELRKPPHPRTPEIIEALAVKRGSEIGVKHAEAFVLVREIA